MCFYRPVLQGDALPVRIQGLEYMNDDPGAVDVLYAQVQDPSDRYTLKQVHLKTGGYLVICKVWVQTVVCSDVYSDRYTHSLH